MLTCRYYCNSVWFGDAMRTFGSPETMEREDILEFMKSGKRWLDYLRSYQYPFGFKFVRSCHQLLFCVRLRIVIMKSEVEIESI